MATLDWPVPLYIWLLLTGRRCAYPARSSQRDSPSRAPSARARCSVPPLPSRGRHRSSPARFNRHTLCAHTRVRAASFIAAHNSRARGETRRWRLWSVEAVVGGGPFEPPVYMTTMGHGSRNSRLSVRGGPPMSTGVLVITNSISIIAA